MTKHNFPIILTNISIVIPWEFAEIAFRAYEKKYGSGQSLETIAVRGGFGVEEMDEFCPEWREHIEFIRRS